MNNFEFWRKTHTVKPFENMEDFYKFEIDCCKVSELDIQAPAAMKKSRIKRGISDGNSFDSFWEYTFFKYMRDVEGQSIERNKTDWIAYVGPDGKQHRFYYDFLCGGLKYEIKGQFRESDIEKMKQCPQVIFIQGDEIKRMKEALTNKFGKIWEADFTQTN
jgi:hypothetical protein